MGQQLQSPISESKYSIKNFHKFTFPMLALIVTVVIIGIVFNFLRVIQKPEKIQQQTNEYILPTRSKDIAGVTSDYPIISEGNAEDGLIGKSIFIQEVPNFDSLKLPDLPSFSYYKITSIVATSDEYVIAGNGYDYGKVLVFDKNSHHILKQNGIRLCEGSNVVLDNFMYYSCDGSNLALEKDSNFIIGTVYKIDINSGLILKSYSDGNINRPFAYSIKLINLDPIVWGISYKSILQITHPSDTLKIYNTQSIQGKRGFPCITKDYFIQDNRFIVWNNKPDCLGVTEYDDINDLWIYEPDMNVPYNMFEDYKNKQQLKLPFAIPQYDSISNLVNDKYYIFGNNVIYTLIRHSFPQQIHSYKLSPRSDTQIHQGFLSEKSYVTSDERYAVLYQSSFVISGGLGKSGSLSDMLNIYLVDLTNGNTINLVKNINKIDPIWESLSSVIHSPNLLNFEYGIKGIVIKIPDDQSKQLFIDFQSKTIRFI